MLWRKCISRSHRQSTKLDRLTVYKPQPNRSCDNKSCHSPSLRIALFAMSSLHSRAEIDFRHQTFDVQDTHRQVNPFDLRCFSAAFRASAAIIVYQIECPGSWDSEIRSKTPGPCPKTSSQRKKELGSLSTGVQTWESKVEPPLKPGSLLKVGYFYQPWNTADKVEMLNGFRDSTARAIPFTARGIHGFLAAKKLIQKKYWPADIIIFDDALCEVSWFVFCFKLQHAVLWDVQFITFSAISLLSIAIFHIIEDKYRCQKLA